MTRALRRHHRERIIAKRLRKVRCILWTAKGSDEYGKNA